MKLKLPQLVSQRDSRWSNEFLGNNTTQPYTIGMYGCLITCLANYLGKSPVEVNQLLKDNNGFVNGGLFVWGKSTVLGLTQTYVSPRYDDPVTPQGITKIQSFLDDGYPLLCEVDFNPATTAEEMHFVEIIGYTDTTIIYADPWDGLEKDWSYDGAKRAILQFRSYDLKLPKDDGSVPDIQKELDTCRVDRDANHNDRIALYEELGFDGVFNRTLAVEKIKQLMALEKSYTEKDKQVTDLTTQLQQVKEQLASKITEDTKTQQELNTTKGLVEELQKKYEDSQSSNSDLSRRITGLEKQLQDCATSNLSAWGYIVKGISLLFGR